MRRSSLSHYQGCMLGDALGAPIEFGSLAAIRGVAGANSDGRTAGRPRPHGGNRLRALQPWRLARLLAAGRSNGLTIGEVRLTVAAGRW